MKRILLIVAILMLAGTSFAGDPNSMNPVTIQRDPDTKLVTIVFYMADVDKRQRSGKYEPVSDVTIWQWINDPDFLILFQRLYQAFPGHVRKTIRERTRNATWDESRAISNRVDAERIR